MLKKENEYYLRSLLLLHYGGSYITKQIIHRELPKYGGDLDSLLRCHKESGIKHEFKNRKQQEKLFPPSGQADINNWDIQMLVGTILILFPKLNKEEKQNLRDIKKLRHDLAHSATAVMGEEKYKDFKGQLSVAITDLASGFEKTVIDHCAELTKTYESCHLDASSYIEFLKELNETGELFEKILEEIKNTRQSVSGDITEATSEICETVKQTSQDTVDKITDQIETSNMDLKSNIAANRQLLLDLKADLNKKKKKHPFEKHTSIVDAELIFSGDEEAVQMAYTITSTVINEAIKRMEGSIEKARIRQAVDDLLGSFNATNGARVLSAETKCIVIKIQCDDYNSLHDILSNITGHLYEQHLEDLSRALSDELRKPVTLHSSIPSECLQTILDDMENTTMVKHKPISLPIQCETVEGLQNVIDLFESNGFSEKLKELSESLSEHVDGKVSIDALVSNISIKETKGVRSNGEEETDLNDNCPVESTHLAKEPQFDNECHETTEEDKVLCSKELGARPKDTRSKDKRQIVAAIDIGTTFTTYAYSYENEYKRDHLKIYACDQWTNSLGYPTTKTPTVVLFDEKDKFHSFGYEAEIKYAELKEDESNILFRWKIINDLSLKYQNDQFVVMDKQNRPMMALDVYAAVLKYLKAHLLNTLQYRLDNIDGIDIQYIVTVPATWCDKKKQIILDAAQKACFSRDRLALALQTEMAAIYCKEFLVSKRKEFRKVEKQKTFSSETQFIVVDAGGRTINVTAHEVQADGTMTELLPSNQLSPSDGSWGGCQIDFSLTAFIEDLFGPAVMDKFKHECCLDALELQHSLEMMKRQCKDPENEKEDYKFGLKIPPTLFEIVEQLNDSIFSKSPAVKKVDVLVKKNKIYVSNYTVIDLYRESKSKFTSHLREILRDPHLKNVKTIVITGGFSDSEIVRNEVRLSFQNKTVIVPDDAGLAIVKGAVMYGHGTRL